MSQHDLDANLSKRIQNVVLFIVSNYAITWFDFKCEPDMKDAPKHVLHQVQLLKHLPASICKIVKPYVKSWFAHPESLLVAMLCDEDAATRAKRVNKILVLVRHWGHLGPGLQITSSQLQGQKLRGSH